MYDGVINIDKPGGVTSHGIVSLMRRKLSIRRVGHCGTLDPMATGVLPVCIGKATRAVRYIMDADKEYVAGMRFGMVTDTQDITGTVLETRNVMVSESRLRTALSEFVGDIEQKPPMYSAVKKDGHKLYELARRGIEVERDSRRVRINEIELLEFDAAYCVIRVSCSKGTYIRTLCHDVGQSLGVGAAMQSLCRTKNARFEIERSVRPEFVDAASIHELDAFTPLNLLFAHLPRIQVGAREASLIRNGVPLRCEQVGAYERGHELYAVYEGDCLLILAREDGSLMRMETGFYGT